MKVFRNCCEEPLKKYRSQIDPEIRFAHQDASLQNQIYNELLQNIRNDDIQDDLRAVLFDMLESTEEDERWLFQGIVALTLKNSRRRVITVDSESSAAEKASSNSRKKPLAIDERT
ncbi:hypothetical protein TWF718_001529 [Orbilia javanica]|uniref:Uncharacterized protein n=1 Tax=Orbilia javanica TaxID=47235 RepID=A0AAN8P2P1_9PEZI